MKKDMTVISNCLFDFKSFLILPRTLIKDNYLLRQLFLIK